MAKVTLKLDTKSQESRFTQELVSLRFDPASTLSLAVSESGSRLFLPLIQDLGTQPITGPLAKKLEEILGDAAYHVRRRIFFSHRDLDLVLNDYSKGKGLFLYTGRGPSGPMHIGHIIQFYFTKWLQDKFHTTVYIQITDDEKFLEEKRNLSYEDTQRWAVDNILEIAAVGFDPDRTFILQDTEFIGHAYPMVLKIARRVNFSTVKSVFGFTGETNIGFAFYPSIQILR